MAKKKRGRGIKLGIKRTKAVRLFSKFGGTSTRGAVARVAEALGCSYTTARYHLKQAGALD